MPCFMPENLHSQDGADTSSENCRKKQGFFRNTPFFMAGFLLINSHKYKTKNIDKNQKEEHNIRNDSEFHV